MLALLEQERQGVSGVRQHEEYLYARQTIEQEDKNYSYNDEEGSQWTGQAQTARV